MATLKLFFEDPSNTEVRRVPVGFHILQSYDALSAKITSLFLLHGKKYAISWKDEEGDNVVISSSEELGHAVQNIGVSGLVKFYIKVVGTKSEPDSHKAKNEGEVHPNVTCDACNGQVKGYRYKCLQCEDYDLCSACNAVDKHVGHDMLKMASPALYPHEWSFPGIARMWRSMFGHACPRFGGRARRGCQRNTCEEGKRTRGHHREFLKTVGSTITDFLDPFGIQVEVDVSPPESDTDVGGEQKKNMESEKNEEPKKTKEPEKNKEPEKSKEPEQEKEIECKQADKPAEDINQVAKDLGENTVPKVVPENNSSDAGYASAVHVSEPVQGVRQKGQSSQERKKKVVPSSSPVKESSPSDAVSTSIAGGWTVINKAAAENASGTENSKPDKALKNTGLYPQNVTFEDKVLKSTASETVTSNKGVAASAAASASASPEVPIDSAIANSLSHIVQMVFPNEDPQIASALAKMMAMGFTNEGGWLARLLQTKNGNISEAIDALYPNPSSRH